MCKIIKSKLVIRNFENWERVCFIHEWNSNLIPYSVPSMVAD